MDSNNAKKYVLSIFDDKYTIVTDQSELHVRAAADYISSIMNDIAQKASDIPPKKIAVLAALKVASSLIALQEEHQLEQDVYKQLVRDIESQIADIA